MPPKKNVTFPEMPKFEAKSELPPDADLRDMNDAMAKISANFAIVFASHDRIVERRDTTPPPASDGPPMGDPPNNNGTLMT